MKVAIIGAGLAGLSAAVDLVDAGHSVDIYEARPFFGGKVGSWEDSENNHIEMGLHVFFFNYANLFALMKKVGAIENLLPKEHTHFRGGAGLAQYMQDRRGGISFATKEILRTAASPTHHDAESLRQIVKRTPNLTWETRVLTLVLAQVATLASNRNKARRKPQTNSYSRLWSRHNNFNSR